MCLLIVSSPLSAYKYMWFNEIIYMKVSLHQNGIKAYDSKFIHKNKILKKRGSSYDDSSQQPSLATIPNQQHHHLERQHWRSLQPKDLRQTVPDTPSRAIPFLGGNLSHTLAHNLYSDAALHLLVCWRLDLPIHLLLHPRTASGSFREFRYAS